MAIGNPKNQYNVVNPTGTDAVNYTDNRYMDGDGTLYWTGMIAQRVLVKGEDLTADGGLTWSGSSTSRTLGINLNHYGGLKTDSSGLAINLGQGLEVGTSSSAPGYHKVNVGLYTPNIGTSSVPNYANMSGLEFSDNTDDGKLKLKLYELSIGGDSLENVSGLEIVAPFDIDSPQMSSPGGLKVNYGSGLTIGTSGADYGKLIVDSSAVVPNITGTIPITVTTNGSNKAIGLKLVDNRASTPANISGLEVVGTAGTGYSTGLRVKAGNGISVGDTVAVNTYTGSGITVNTNGVSLDMANVVGGDLTYSGCTISVDKSTTVSNGDTKPVTSGAVYTAIASAVADLEAADFHFEIFAQLPGTTPPSTVTDETTYNTYKQTIALIAHIQSDTARDVYDEYIIIRTGSENNYSYRWELIGSTGFVTDNFVQKTDVLTSSDINAIVTDVFGF